MAAQAAIVAIHIATGANDIETVATMLDEDPRLLSSVWDGDTPLTRAVWRRHLRVVTLLLEKGADANTVDAHGTPALYIAAMRGYEELVSLLLTSGADASIIDGSGWTALIHASRWGHVAVVRVLLRSMGSRQLDVTDRSGCTALWIACCYGYADVVRALLRAGADHTIASTKGRTPLQTAQGTYHHECVALIEVSGSPSLMPVLILNTCTCSPSSSAYDLSPSC
jgi:ankyrin repeat protein